MKCSQVLTKPVSPVALACEDYFHLLFRGKGEERTLPSEILNGGLALERSDGFICTVFLLRGSIN